MHNVCSHFSRDAPIRHWPVCPCSPVARPLGRHVQ